MHTTGSVVFELWLLYIASSTWIERYGAKKKVSFGDL